MYMTEISLIQNLDNRAGIFYSNGTRRVIFADSKDGFKYKTIHEIAEIALEKTKHCFSDCRISDKLISYDDLYNRIVVWEDFINSHQDFFLNKTAVKFFQHYLSVLLTGMDNTPAFSRENGVLNSELKSLYEKVINIADLRESTDIITEYYNLLKANQFKQPKEMNSFLERHDLYSMKAVQPLLR